MKAAFAAALAFSTVAFAAPVAAPKAADPAVPLKPILNNQVQVQITIAGGYYAYENFLIDGPAKTVGRQWQGSSIDSGGEIHGTFITANSTLGPDIKCALQDETRHDIAIMSEGDETQDLTGSSAAIRLTDHIVFCYCDKGDGKVPTPSVEDEEILVSSVSVVITNADTDRSAYGNIIVDAAAPIAYKTLWGQVKNIGHDGHVFATKIEVSGFLDGVVCTFFNDKSHDIAVLNSGNKDEIVGFGAAGEVNVDDYSISCKHLSSL